MTNIDSNENTAAPRRLISCDEVAWLMRSLECLLGAAVSPTATRTRTQGAKSACLVEIMDTLGLGFEDKAAAFNALELHTIRDALAPEFTSGNGGTIK